MSSKSERTIYAVLLAEGASSKCERAWMLVYSDVLGRPGPKKKETCKNNICFSCFASVYQNAPNIVKNKQTKKSILKTNL